MKAYLDMCALKRPFDDQSQGRIWMETQAVAFAESQEADYFVTADDEILKHRDRAKLDVKICDPIECVDDLDL